MYSTLSADEQDYELDEFVCCAEEYIELEYLPALVDVLFANCGTNNFWKIMLVLEPFFYYIEDVGGDDDEDEDNVDNSEGDEESLLSRNVEGDDNVVERHFKPDPRVITLEKYVKLLQDRNGYKEKSKEKKQDPAFSFEPWRMLMHSLFIWYQIVVQMIYIC